MARIFISYRRDDSKTISGRIYDRLEETFGKRSVFKDVESIPYGVDFRKVIDDSVGRCDVQVVIIGQKWLTIADPATGQRRLDNPDDFVRLEIESALNRDILVVPVLVEGAGMPSPGDLPSNLQPLAYRNAARVRDDPDFHRDMDRLITSVKRSLSAGRSQINAGQGPVRRFYWFIAAALVIAAIIIIALVLNGGNGDDPGDTSGSPATTESAAALLPPETQFWIDRTLTAIGPSTPTQTPTITTTPTSTPDFTQTYAAVAAATEGQQTIAAGRTDTLPSTRALTMTPTPIVLNIDSVPMVYVPSGCFMMGVPEAESTTMFQACEEARRLGGNCLASWFEAEAPIHEVCLTGYHIGQTEVTNAQYRRCVDAGACDPPEDTQYYDYADDAYADHPVVYVSWDDANQYTAWLSETIGGDCALPTEAQWEYAARGPEGWAYPWGDEAPTCDRANIADCGGGTLPVGPARRAAGASWVGALDMAGSVWEWSADWYGAGYYASLAALDTVVQNPIGPERGDTRVLRGGSFNDDWIDARAAKRGWDQPNGARWYSGFRVVCESGRD